LLKKISFTLLAIITLSICALPQSPETRRAVSLDEALGADDGAALAILFGANQRGNLDLCD
jgi:hypothetical protein